MSAEEFERYRHDYGDGNTALVWVGKAWKGKHRSMCLCFRCDNFKPGTDQHCPIAQANYELCVKNSTCQPMFECPEFNYSPDTEAAWSQVGT